MGKLHLARQSGAPTLPERPKFQPGQAHQYPVLLQRCSDNLPNPPGKASPETLVATVHRIQFP